MNDYGSCWAVRASPMPKGWKSLLAMHYIKLESGVSKYADKPQIINTCRKETT